MTAATGLSTRVGCRKPGGRRLGEGRKGLENRDCAGVLVLIFVGGRDRKGSMTPAFSPLARCYLLLTRRGVARVSEPRRCARAFPSFAVCFTSSTAATSFSS
jgi:hypothetical protein